MSASLEGWDSNSPGLEKGLQEQTCESMPPLTLAIVPAANVLKQGVEIITQLVVPSILIPGRSSLTLEGTHWIFRFTSPMPSTA
ncbi:hypothetical protein MUP01_10595 [Candidatus Bathyarchaeota archaeon]|nr:hypothetical protein [Candidatus Bathyarchaeota archaeon]